MSTQNIQTEAKKTDTPQNITLGQPSQNINTTVTKTITNPQQINTEKVSTVNPQPIPISTVQTTPQSTRLNVSNQQQAQPTSQIQQQVPSDVQQTVPSRAVPYTIGQMMSGQTQNVVQPTTFTPQTVVVPQNVQPTQVTTPQVLQTPPPRKESPKVTTRSGRAVKQRFSDEFVELSESEEEEKDEKQRKRKRKPNEDEEYVVKEGTEEDEEEGDEEEYVEEGLEPEGRENVEGDDDDDEAEEYEIPKKKRTKRTSRYQTHGLIPGDGKVAIPQWNPMNSFKPLAPMGSMLKYPILSGQEQYQPQQQQQQQQQQTQQTYTSSQQPDPSVLNSPGFQQYYQQYLKNMMNSTKNAIVTPQSTLQSLNQHDDSITSFQDQSSLGMSGHIYSDTSQLLSSNQAPSSVLHRTNPTFDSTTIQDPTNPTNGYNLFNQDTFNK